MANGAGTAGAATSTDGTATAGAATAGVGAIGAAAATAGIGATGALAATAARADKAEEPFVEVDGRGGVMEWSRFLGTTFGGKNEGHGLTERRRREDGSLFSRLANFVLFPGGRPHLFFDGGFDEVLAPFSPSMGISSPARFVLDAHWLSLESLLRP